MKFFESNKTLYRLLRTIIQGVIGVLIANIDILVDQVPQIADPVRPVIVLIVMAILSPIMAAMGGDSGNE